MIVHVASFLESIGGSIDKAHYLRPIPGRVGYAAYCRKPEYSKKKQKEMAGRKMVKQLTEISKEASAILKDQFVGRSGKRNIKQLCEKRASTNACQTRKESPMCLDGCAIM